MRTKTFILVAVAVFAALVGGVVYVALGGDDDRRVGALNRSFTAGNWALELEGESGGYLKGIDGCHVESEVSDAQANKVARAPKYGSCELRFGLGMGKPLYDWITSALDKGAQPKDLTLVQTDGTGKAVSSLLLRNTVLTRFALPALAAGAKEQATFEITVLPEVIERGKAGTAGKPALSQKQITGSNFSVKIGSIDTTKVTHVDAWSFEVPITESQIGSDKFQTKQQGQPVFSDLTVETPEASAAGFDAAADSWLKGNPAEWPASIELLDATLKNTLVKVDFTAVGMRRADLYGASETTEGSVRRSYSFYVEGAKLNFASGA